MSARLLTAAELCASEAPGADGFVRAEVSEGQWIGLVRALAEGQQDLYALWFDDGQVRMAILSGSARVIASLACEGGQYPSVGQFHTPAIRLERAMHDLHNLTPRGLPDGRGWLDHGVWPHKSPTVEGGPEPYRFLPVEGEGLHQIPVGPVHAGIIEPGHFRFTANGEAVVRLEERLGYVHKGIEALCAGKSIPEAARVAARISGDSTVAYSFAFARAVEAATGTVIPRRAEVLRGIMAELERIAHHVSDFGAICNDASMAALHAHCALLRERVLRTCAACFGHRLMMDLIVPGGVAADVSEEGVAAIRRLAAELAPQIVQIARVYEGTPSLLDRTVRTGKVSPALAAKFAAGGYVGRASGRKFDTRRDVAYVPYDGIAFKVIVLGEGDVNARALVRLRETQQSLRMIEQLLDLLPPGPVRVDVAQNLGQSHGAALVEAFRGDAFVAVRLGEDGRVARLHARDASWFHWPLLEAAIEGNIVADFPLCNKSFNCSYSGHDM